MQQINEEATSKIKAVAHDLKCFEAEENIVVEAIQIAQQKMVSTSKEKEKARQIIAKAQAVLSKAELTHAAETAKLSLLTARSIHIQKEERKKATELEEAWARLTKTVSVAELTKTVSVAEEELKKQAAVQAEENKRI